jgi:Tol biopolymer transport system component
MHLSEQHFRRGAIALFVVVAALAAAAAATAASGTTERVSVATGDAQANGPSGLDSWRPALSGDGNLIAFDSTASNLVPAATSGQDDIYLRSRSGAALQLLSATSTGSEPNGPSSEPDLNGDGRYVAFHTYATNLAAGGNLTGIVVLDRNTHAITPVSVSGKNSVDGHDPSISDDGRYVAFESPTAGLASGSSSGKSGGGSTGVAVAGTISSYVYVRDLVKQKTQLVSVNSAGKAAGPSFDPVISADGRYVAFDSDSPLVPNDSNGSRDVYVRDLQAGTTTRVSVKSGGGQGPGNYFAPSISGDGRYVAFDAATPLGADDTNGKLDVYVHDTVTGQTTRVSVDSAGSQADGHSDNFSLGGVQDGRLAESGPQISDDGRYVTFESEASNLVAGDTNTCTIPNVTDFSAPGQCPDVFVHDLQTGATSRVSVDSNGAQADGPSTDPAIDGDGSVVAFLSGATNLVAGDTNGATDVFAHAG